MSLLINNLDLNLTITEQWAKNHSIHSSKEKTVSFNYTQMKEETMNESNTKIAGKTPWHLWVIGIVGLLWSAMGAMDYVMTQTRNEEYMSNFTPEQLEFFYGFPVWVVAAWAVAVWGEVLGAIFLLLRKAWAVPVFLASFIAMVIVTIHNYVLSNGLEVVGDATTLVFTAVIFFVALFLWLYSRAMQQRGVLN
jgi:uncharacterized membrane protein YphA (DoxX/SURF4 family)